MSLVGAFQPILNTVSLTTSGTPSTAQSRQLTPQNFGFAAGVTIFPQCVRLVNRGTSDVWVSLTAATATIVIPTPGTTTAGTPQLAWILIPGAVEIWTVPVGPQLWVNDISVGASQTYHLVLGEGL